MTIRFPATTFTILRAQQITESVEQRVLIIGQKEAAGSAASGALVENVPESKVDIAALFGGRSILAEMAREFKAINSQTALDVIALADNAGGAAATTPIVFTGTATENGSLFISAGSDSGYRFRVDVLNGDTDATVAGKLEAAIDAVATAPFTAALATATVTLTAANAGPIANDWTVFVEGAVAGIAVAISAWSGGATGPDLANLFDVIAGKRYQTIVWPSDFDNATLATELDTRFNVQDQVLQGVGITTVVGTATEAQAAATALNSQSMMVIASKAISTTTLVGSAHREFPDVISARVAAVRSLRFTDDALLTGIITTAAPLDQFGGRALASLPYANTILPNMPIIRPADQFAAAELIANRDNGVSVVGANDTFSRMILGEMVTTNTTDDAANPDDSFKFLNTVDTIAAIRDAHFLNFKARYAQTRLTDGALVAGRANANKASIEAFGDEIFQSLQDDVLVQAGAEALEDNKLNRVVEVDVAAGKVTYTIAPLLVGGLRVIIGTIAVKFVRS